MEFIQQHAQYVTIILGAISTVFLFAMTIKKWIVKKYKERMEYLKSRNEIPTTLSNIQNTLEVMDNRLQTVEKEITPNGGGSMKDALRLVKAEMEAAFWLDGKPSFRTTSKGLNTLVNEAYCHLCGVSSEDLLRLGWKNYAEDEEQLDDFMRRWRESSEQFSQFTGKLKIKNSKGDSRGEWIFKIRPLGAYVNSNDYLWHGTMTPYDGKAIAYAKEQNIPIN